MKTKLFSAALLVGFAWTLNASADIPPPDSCQVEGEDCANAGPTADAEGVCVKESCERVTPDGPVTYDCLRCLPKEDGKGSGEGGADGAGGHPTLGAGPEGDGGHHEGGADGAGGHDDEPQLGGAGGHEDGPSRGESEVERGEGGGDEGEDVEVEGAGGSDDTATVTSVSSTSTDSSADASSSDSSTGCSVQAPRSRGLFGLGAPLAMVAAGVLALRVSSRRPRG